MKSFKKSREKMMEFLESLNNKKISYNKNKSQMKFKGWLTKSKMKIKKKLNKNRSSK